MDRRAMTKAAAKRIREDWIRAECLVSSRLVDEVHSHPTDPRQIASIAYRRARYRMKHGPVKGTLEQNFKAQRAVLREFLS